MRHWNWKLRTGAAMATAIAAVVVAGTLATLATGDGTTPKPAAHANATATPRGHIAATCRRGTTCNDTPFGHDGDIELTCKEAHTCATTVVPPTGPCRAPAAHAASVCAPPIACPMLAPQPLSPPARDGDPLPACHPCDYGAPDAQPDSASASVCLPRCIEPMAPATTPTSGGTEASPPVTMPACVIRCDVPDMPPCPAQPPCPPAASPDSGATDAPTGSAECTEPMPPCVVVPAGTATAVDPGIPCTVPPSRCGLPVEPMTPAQPDADRTPTACRVPPVVCNGTVPPPETPGGIEPQSAPPCVAPDCAISSDGAIACPTPGSTDPGSSAGSSGAGSSAPGSPPTSTQPVEP